MATDPPELTAEDHQRYAWQMTVPGVGEDGQRRLKAACVLISRIGGVGGCAAQQLAAAGVGHLILLHAGDLRLDDLNRQILMDTASVGTPRLACAIARLHAINPHVRITGIPANACDASLADCIGQADAVVSAAPLFEERHALHRAAVSRGIPCVEAAMYEMDGYVTTVHPPHTARYADWVPDRPEWWQRRFPVFGAVSATIGSLAAVEAIKVLTGIGDPLYNRMMAFDFRSGRVRTIHLPR